MKNVRRDDWETLKPTIYGWGIKDVNYEVTKVEKINGKRKIVWICPYYDDWTNMIQRCKSPTYQINRPNYTGIDIFPEWQYLSNFIKWVDNQPNRDWVNCQLDKDLSAVKIYSPCTCLYISAKLNSFLLERKNDRGSCLLGVDLNKLGAKKPYRSSCSNPFTRKQDYLGMFTTEKEAHKAWQTKKHEHACALADLQDDPRVADALRQRYAPDKDWSKN